MLNPLTRVRALLANDQIGELASEHLVDNLFPIDFL